MIGAGHRFATTRLDAQRSTAGWAKEQMGGISYLFFIRKLAQRVESEWDSVKVGAPVVCLRCFKHHVHRTLCSCSSKACASS